MVNEIKGLKVEIDQMLSTTSESIQEIESRQQKRKTSYNYFVTVVPQFDKSGINSSIMDSGHRNYIA